MAFLGGIPCLIPCPSNQPNSHFAILPGGTPRDSCFQRCSEDSTRLEKDHGAQGQKIETLEVWAFRKLGTLFHGTSPELKKRVSLFVVVLAGTPPTWRFSCWLPLTTRKPDTPEKRLTYFLVLHHVKTSNVNPQLPGTTLLLVFDTNHTHTGKRKRHTLTPFECVARHSRRQRPACTSCSGFDLSGGTSHQLPLI